MFGVILSIPRAQTPGMLWRSLLQAAGQGREADLDIAMEQTMFFLMHSCGLSREAQNEQSHIVVATTNHPSALETSQLPPTSTYAPAASHLASSPTSSPNSGSQKIQQLFLSDHVNQPIETESVNSFHSAHLQQVPAHLDLHTPTGDAPIVALHSAPEAAKEQPPYGLTVRPRRSKRTAKSTNLQATSGPGGHERTEQQDTPMRSTQYQASEQASVSATELSSQSLATDDSEFTTDNKMLMKKLSTKCRKADARIDQLEKENVSLKEQRDSAVARSRELRVESESFKSEIRDCKATIEQFEEENDDLQSELETSEEKVEQLEQDLANPRKSYRIRS
jgi:uncharacterized phage infection (PIP) family protein YhgE